MARGANRAATMQVCQLYGRNVGRDMELGTDTERTGWQHKIQYIDPGGSRGEGTTGGGHGEVKGRKYP